MEGVIGEARSVLVFAQIHYGKHLFAQIGAPKRGRNTGSVKSKLWHPTRGAGAADGKSPPGTLLSNRCRFEARLTPCEGVGVQRRRGW